MFVDNGDDRGKTKIIFKIINYLPIVFFRKSIVSRNNRRFNYFSYYFIYLDIKSWKLNCRSIFTNLRHSSTKTICALYDIYSLSHTVSEHGRMSQKFSVVTSVLLNLLIYFFLKKYIIVFSLILKLLRILFLKIFPKKFASYVKQFLEY